jgi:hypothetical protein
MDSIAILESGPDRGSYVVIVTKDGRERIMEEPECIFSPALGQKKIPAIKN